METFSGILTNFKAWEGGKYTLDILRKNGDCVNVEWILHDIFYDRIKELKRGEREELITKGELNDFLWFERDLIANWLGFETWEEYEEEREKENEKFLKK